MKQKFYILLLLALMSTGMATAQRTLITVVANGGNWSSASTWSPSGIPQSGDSIVIPAGFTVILDNSYTLNNVFITIGGTLNFKQNNTLALDATSVVDILSGGTLTATHPTPNELLTIAGVTKYDGKSDGTITGPSEATDLTGTSPSGFSEVVLPVTFVSFTASRSNDAVELTWSTTNDINNSRFEVERSTDGSTWETIGNIAAIAGSLDNTYSYTDEAAPAAQTQYRICEVDLNANYMYSTVVLVAAGTTTAAAQATIVARGRTVSIFPGNVSGSRLIVRLITIGGQVLQQQSFESTSGRIDMNVSASIIGVYVVQVTDGSQWSVARKVIL